MTTTVKGGLPGDRNLPGWGSISQKLGLLDEIGKGKAQRDKRKGRSVQRQVDAPAAHARTVQLAEMETQEEA